MNGDSQDPWIAIYENLSYQERKELLQNLENNTND